MLSDKKLPGVLLLVDPGQKAVNGDDVGEGDGISRGGTQSEKERRRLKDKQLMVIFMLSSFFVSYHVMLCYLVSSYVTKHCMTCHVLTSHHTTPHHIK